jgi:hypothetical protein
VQLLLNVVLFVEVALANVVLVFNLSHLHFSLHVLFVHDVAVN